MLKFITILLNRLPIRVDCHVDDTMALNHNTTIRYLRKSNILNNKTNLVYKWFYSWYFSMTFPLVLVYTIVTQV